MENTRFWVLFSSSIFTNNFLLKVPSESVDKQFLLVKFYGENQSFPYVCTFLLCALIIDSNGSCVRTFRRFSMKFKILSSLYCFPIILMTLAAQSSLAQGVSGTWSITENVNATACGEGVYVDSYTATAVQSGSTVTVSAGGIVRTGALSGSTLTYSTTYSQDGGTVNSTGTMVFSASNVSGSANWTWSGAGQSCAGSSVISGVLTASSEPAAAVPVAPVLRVSTSGTRVTASWGAVQGASSYTLFYAPYPAQSPVASIDLGAALSVSEVLPVGSAFYLAVQAHNAAGSSDISNIGQFSINESNGTDIIEIANDNSNIAAIVYENQSNLVLFYDKEVTGQYTSIMRFSDGNKLTLRGRTNGYPTHLEVAGYSFDYQYLGAGRVTTTVTAPDGTTQKQTENPQALSNLLSFALRGPCYSQLSCALEESGGQTYAAFDEAKLEDALNVLINTLKRTPFTVLGCPFWLSGSTCEALSNYIDEAGRLGERVVKRTEQKIAHLNNALKCTVSEDICASVAVQEAPKIASQIEQLKLKGIPPNASFEIGASAAKPVALEWQSYFASSGLAMTDVPCSESVFSNVRPECNGQSTGDSIQIPETIAYTTRDQMAALCDSLGLQVQNDPQSISVYCTIKNTSTWLGPYFEFRKDGTPSYGINYVLAAGSSVAQRQGPIIGWSAQGSVTLESQYIKGKQEGTAKTYSDSGELESQGEYKGGYREGVWKFYRNGSLLREDTYANNVVIASKNYGDSGSSFTYVLSCSSSNVCAEYETNSQSQYNSLVSQCGSGNSTLYAGTKSCPSAPNCRYATTTSTQTNFVYNESSSFVQSACVSSNGIFSSR